MKSVSKWVGPRVLLLFFFPLFFFFFFRVLLPSLHCSALKSGHLLCDKGNSLSRAPSSSRPTYSMDVILKHNGQVTLSQLEYELKTVYVKSSCQPLKENRSVPECGETDWQSIELYLPHFLNSPRSTKLTPPFPFFYSKMNPQSTPPWTQIEENGPGLEVDLGHSSASPHPNPQHNCLQVPEPLWTMVSVCKSGAQHTANSASLWKSYARAPCLQQFNTKSRHFSCSQLGAVLSSPGSICDLSGNIPGGHSHLWVRGQEC